MANMDKNRRPILYKGEIYSKSIQKKLGGKKKEPAISYGAARERVLSDIEKTKQVIEKIPADKKLSNEFVVCVRLSPEFSAKSYYPSALFDSIGQNGQAEEIGSRLWRKKEPGTEKDSETGKLFFVRTTTKGLEQLEEQLSQDELGTAKNFAYDVRKIESLDTLTSQEQISGIPTNWIEGRLEAVLHPFEKDKDAALKNFLELLKESKVDLEKVRYKQYESGITFVSLYGTKETISRVADYNPLRTIHTLELRDLPVTRGDYNPPL
jgi:hypothetical protein